MVDLILEPNSGHTRLLINNQLSQRTSILSGVKQGDPLAPTLFIVCIQPYLALLHHHGIHTQAYADDTLVFLRQTEDIQQLVNIAQRYGETSGQQLNHDKCTLLVQEDDERFQQHPEATEDRYLGIQLRANGTITILPSTMDSVETLLRRWKASHISVLEKATIIKYYVRPRLLYQLPYSKADVDAISKMERWFFSPSPQRAQQNRPLLSTQRQEHPTAFFGLVPFNTELRRRRAAIFHHHKWWLQKEDPISPTTRLLKKAWIETTKQFPPAKIT